MPKDRIKLIIISQIPIGVLIAFAIFFLYPKVINLESLRQEYQRRNAIASDWWDYRDTYILRKNIRQKGTNLELLPTINVKLGDTNAKTVSIAFPEFIDALKQERCLRRKENVFYDLDQLYKISDICSAYLKGANVFLAHGIAMILMLLGAWTVIAGINYVIWGKQYYSQKRNAKGGNGGRPQA